MDRKAIPARVKRQVVTEAGDRCSIPTCRQFPIELAHIIPYRETKDHSPENLIALCPTCHTRYDAGQIPRDRMLVYKANTRRNLERFNSVEMAILEAFLRAPDRVVNVAENMMFLFERLSHDQLVVIRKPPGEVRSFGVSLTPLTVSLSERGKKLVVDLSAGHEIK